MDILNFNTIKNKKHLYGMSVESFNSMFLADYLKNNDKFTLILTKNELQAQSFVEEIEFFVGKNKKNLSNSLLSSDISYLPGVEHSVYTDILPDRTTVRKRLSVFARLIMGYNSNVYVTSIKSLAKKTIPPDFFDRNSHLLGVGLVIQRNELVKILVKNGFQNVDIVEDPACFAVRGQVVDIYVPVYEYPVRITFWDDEIESLYFFDPSTQKRLGQIDELILYPVRETIPDKNSNLRSELYALADEVGYPASKTRYIMERIESGEEFFGMETLFPLYHQNPCSIFDYFPNDFQIIVDDPEGVEFEFDELLTSEQQKYKERKENHQIAISPERFYLTKEELYNKVEQYSVKYLHKGSSSNGIRHFSVKSLLTLKNTLNKNESDKYNSYTTIKEKLEKHIEEGGISVLCITSDFYRSHFVKLLEEDGFNLINIESETRLSTSGLKPGSIFVRKGNVRKGFDLESGLFMLVTEEEIFGTKIKSSRKKKNKFPVQNTDSLKPNEPVVHKIHGVGIYKGIFTMSPAGVKGEYILIEYSGGDRFYLPAHKISMLSLYQGGKKDNVRPDKLGGKTWEKKKKKVSAKVKELAEKLLQSSLERQARQGFSYPATDPMLTEFEATFPYEETPDQASSIEDTYSDMASTKTMDRLICGDVGYGKTEIALRASMLAVLGGKQVALLAPTTLLVEQHYRTFKERYSGFPVIVDAVSRFRSSAKNKITLNKLANGEIDILIGTHRILSKDVHFKDLGLLIIDEEQRFGVAQKEKFRFFKPDLDVLTLSATPIPRTLQMGIMGVKDISIIVTPPVDRMPVQTNVAPADINTIAQAIRHEMARGGQVFAVTPRINVSKGSGKKMEDWVKLIEKAVPEARLAVAHGQMDASKLEKVMIEFIAGNYDVLVSTNIIEAGIDISRANTIIVFDAQNFGLSQLYQLRGRVGRGKVKAYAYFLVPGFNKLTKDAKKRLLAIQRHTALGSGFNLASEDLEIRGAGDVLGEKQSGNIASVGFETYVELVKEAVEELRGEKTIPENDPELNTDISGYLPEEYIPEPTERLKFYRRYATASNESEVDEVSEFLFDMYGPPPDEVKKLEGLMKIKVQLRYLNATAINISNHQAVVYFDEHTLLDPTKILKLVSKEKEIILENSFKIKLKFGKTENNFIKIQRVMMLLHKLISCVNTPL